PDGACRVQSGDARIDVDYASSREVKDTQVVQPPSGAYGTPDPVGDWVVDERGPGQGENDERAKLQTTYERPCDKCWRDDREHRLEYHVCQVRHCGPVGGVGRVAYPPETG